ncbi:MAG: SLATT domain-containing protein [Bacteroidota bacterium]|jgi:hypothetical protein|nr:SLATT domain-containing protein [Flammeovirgaceae bacterium]MCZ8071963.1 SLATT domain-containing protein [Cytophagales bacterium]
MSFVYLYPIMAVAPSVLLFTGHLLDAANRETTRFPHSMLDEAKVLISKSIDELAKVNSISVAIASLGAGGDMLFAAEVLKRNVPLHIFIPTEKGQFIEESVTYLKSVEGEDAEAWKLEFERILALAEKVVFTKPDHAEQNLYAACNTKMLQHAFELASTERGVVGLALVKPGEEKIEGGAAHFLEEMRSKQVPVQILWPGERNVVPAEVRELSRFIPLFKHLDEEATFYQSRWRSRLKFSLLVLAAIAFFDAFVTVPDHFLFGHGQVLRMVCLIISAAGAFVTLQMQLSDKTSLSQWTNSRAKAEQIRSEIWFYLFNYWSENNRFGPYTESEFEIYLKRMAPGNWNRATLDMTRLIGLKQVIIFFSMQQKIDYYRQYRLDDQLAYFKKKKKYFTNRIRIYKTVTLLFLSVSIVWGICKMIGEFNPAFSFFMDMSPLGMMISFIALVASYAEANNSKEMEYKYFQMGEGLTQLIENSSTVQRENDFDLWVKECETFLRTQNNEWSLKREK